MKPHPCIECGVELEAAEDICPGCGHQAPPPNVRLAFDEGLELLTREARARAAVAEELRPVLARLSTLVASASVVVNVDPAFAHQVITRDRTQQVSYHALLAAGARRPAAHANDRQRTVVDALLFGSVGPQIGYAALSARAGLRSYGLVTLHLKLGSLERRTSLLEENAYDFIRRHGVTDRSPPPRGYRAPLCGRVALATAKLAGRLRTDPTDDELADLLLHSGADRAADDFIEAHIWGPLHRSAVEAVTVTEAVTIPIDRVHLSEAHRVATSELNIRWNGYPS